MFEQSDKQWNELEQRFSRLAPKIKNSPEKEAISILHGLILETRRNPSKAEGLSSGSVIDNNVANLYRSAPGMSGPAENKGLPVGSMAPDFSLPDARGRMISLNDFRGQVVVLIFYPLDWSPACSDQLSLYESEIDEFRKHGATVIAISVDSIYSHGAWAYVRKISFPLLSDFNPCGEVARAYQVYRKGDGFSERAIYIIDINGYIQFSHVSPELPKIPDIYDLFDALKKIKTQPGRDNHQK